MLKKITGKNKSMQEEFDYLNKETDEIGAKKSGRLFKATKNAMLAGICAGVSKYSGINVINIRIIFFSIALITGWGLFFYAFLAIVLPPDYLCWQERDFNKDDIAVFHKKSVTATVLIVTGVYFFLNDLGLFSLFWFVDLKDSIILPIIALFIGIYFLKKSDDIILIKSSLPQKLEKLQKGKRIAGICSGMGEYLNVDVTIVRMLWLLSAFATLGITVLVYFLLAFLLPFGKEGYISEEQ